MVLRGLSILRQRQIKQHIFRYILYAQISLVCGTTIIAVPANSFLGCLYNMVKQIKNVSV